MPNEETFPRRLGSGGDPQAIPLQLLLVQHQKGCLESKRARKAREAASSNNERLPKIKMDGEEE